MVVILLMPKGEVYRFRTPEYVGCALAFLALLQGWLLCVGFVCLANVLKIAWGWVCKVMDVCIVQDLC
jgi:hypothetical protein